MPDPLASWDPFNTLVTQAVLPVSPTAGEVAAGATGQTEPSSFINWGTPLLTGDTGTLPSTQMIDTGVQANQDIGQAATDTAQFVSNIPGAISGAVSNVGTLIEYGLIAIVGIWVLSTVAKRRS